MKPHEVRGKTYSTPKHYRTDYGLEFILLTMLLLVQLLLIILLMLKSDNNFIKTLVTQ